MFRSPPVQLVLALGALTLGACAEDRTPTEPGAEPASAAASPPPSPRTPGP